MPIVVGEATGTVQYFVGTIHNDDDDCLLYFTAKVFVGSSTIDSFILAEGAPILTNDMVSAKHSEIPFHIGDIVKITGRA